MLQSSRGKSASYPLLVGKIEYMLKFLNTFCGPWCLPRTIIEEGKSLMSFFDPLATAQIRTSPRIVLAPSSRGHQKALRLHERVQS